MILSPKPAPLFFFVLLWSSHPSQAGQRGKMIGGAQAKGGQGAHTWAVGTPCGGLHFVLGRPLGRGSGQRRPRASAKCCVCCPGVRAVEGRKGCSRTVWIPPRRTLYFPAPPPRQSQLRCFGRGRAPGLAVSAPSSPGFGWQGRPPVASVPPSSDTVRVLGPPGKPRFPESSPLCAQ